MRVTGERGRTGRHVPHGSAAGRSEGRLRGVFLLTAGYLVVEVAAALFSNSLALLADAGHMLTDVLGLGIALFAVRVARRPATPARTYGFYRAEILAALLNGVVLLALAAYVLVEAWQRLAVPVEVRSGPMLAAAAGGLVVNLIGLKLLRAGSRDSLTMHGAFLEVAADLAASVGAVVAGVVMHFTGWWRADALVSVLIGLFIVPRAWRLLRSALDVLLEASPADVDVAGIEAAMREVPGVQSVHDLHVWTITSGFVAMSGHVEASGRRSSEVLHDVQVLLRERFRIEHATLQVERPDHADDGACCAIDPRCLALLPGPERRLHDRRD